MEKWSVDTDRVTVTFYDESGAGMPAEPIGLPLCS
jgi:hypothetical protein